MAGLLEWANKRKNATIAQINPFDDGRTYNTVMQGKPAPKPPSSVIQQATHSGLSNTIGNLLVKPFVINPGQIVAETGRMTAANITQNTAAQLASQQRQLANLKASIPGFIGQQASDIGQAGFNLGFRAPALDLAGKDAEAERVRTLGLQEFNNTMLGQATRPLQLELTKAAGASKESQQEIGLNPDATFAQNYFADPLMGTLGTIGLVKGAKKAGELGVPATKEAAKQVATKAKRPTLDTIKNDTILKDMLGNQSRANAIASDPKQPAAIRRSAAEFSASLTPQIRQRSQQLQQGGYVRFGGSEKLSEPDFRSEIKKRLQAESDYFKKNEANIKSAKVINNTQVNQPGRNKVIAENRRLFKEFEKDPDKFIDKYGLVPPENLGTAKQNRLDVKKQQPIGTTAKQAKDPNASQLESLKQEAKPNSLDNAIDTYKQESLGSTDTKSLDNLINASSTPEGVAITQQRVSQIPKNADGTITVYRVGDVRSGNMATTTDPGMAKVLAKERASQGLSSDITKMDVTPDNVKAVVPGIENELIISQPPKSPPINVGALKADVDRLSSSNLVDEALQKYPSKPNATSAEGAKIVAGRKKYINNAVKDFNKKHGTDFRDHFDLKAREQFVRDSGSTDISNLVTNTLYGEGKPDRFYTDGNYAKKLMDEFYGKQAPTKSQSPPKSAPSPLESLKQEARKYKSAEEYLSTYEKRYHQTSKEASDAINREGFKIDKRMSGEHDILPIGVNTKRTTKDLGLGDADNQLEVYFDKNTKVKSFNNRAQAEQYFYGHPEGAKYRDAVNKSKQLDIDYQKQVDAVAKQVDDRYKEIYAKGVKAKADPQIKALQAKEDQLIKEWGKKVNIQIKIAQSESTRIAKAEGLDAIDITQDVGSFGRTTDNTIIFDPTKVKTKQQLTDLYNQSQPPKSPLKPPRPPKPTTSKIAPPDVPKVSKALEPASTYTRSPKTPSAFKRAWATVNGVISEYGTGGKEFVQKVRTARENSEKGQQAFITRIPKVSKLNKDDFALFVQTLEARSRGENPKVSPVIAEAVKEWNGAIPLIRDRAIKAGLEVGDLGPNYFPRQYKDLFKNDKSMGRMAEQMVREGKAKDMADAMGKLQFMKSEYQRPFGNLERTRELDLPGYEMTHEALINYVNRSFDRITKAEQFGAKNEKLNELQAKMQSEGYNATPGSTVDRYIRIALGDVDRGTAAHRISSGIRKFNAARSLSTASLANATQVPVNVSTIAGITRTARGIGRALRPDAVGKQARAEARATGVLLDHAINDLAQQGLGTSGKITSNMAAPFFRSVEKFNRMATAIVGKDYGNHLAKKGKHQELREKFGITGDIGKTLTPAQEVQMARALVEKTQFKVDPMDLPGWVDSPMGKLVAQFRTFGYKQTDFMYNQVLREAVKGNFLPLARFTAAAVPAGAASLTIRGTIKGAPYFDQQDDMKDKAFKTIASVGGIGLPGSEIQNLYRGNQFNNLSGSIAGTIGGPTASFITETGDNISRAVDDNVRPLAKQTIRSIPAVGPSIANRVFPKPKQEAPPAKGSPGDIKATAKKELEDIRDKYDKEVVDGYDTHILSDGRYTAQVDGELEVFKDKDAYNDALRRDHLKQSDDSYRIVGDKVYRKSTDGKISVVSKLAFDNDINSAILTRTKRHDDLQGWLATADKQLKNIDEQLKDPTLDELERLKLTNQAESLYADAEKYIGYGGFKKGRSGGGGGSGVSTAGWKTANSSKISVPKGISVRKLSAPTTKIATKKLAPPKLRSNYLNKRLA